MGRRADKQSHFKPAAARPPSAQRAAAPPQVSAATLTQSLATPQQATPQVVLALQRTHGNRAVQRWLDGAAQRSAAVGLEGGPVDGDLERQIQAARGGGQSLDGGIARRAGAALNANFGNVRVHTGAQSDVLSRSLSAQAFTIGSDIFFSRGAYNPGSANGQKLLAHELTHVVQQTGRGQSVQAKLEVGAADDASEREAEAAASLIAGQLGHAETAPIEGGPGGQAQRHVAPDAVRVQRTVKMYQSFEDARKASKKEKISGSETLLTVKDLNTAFNQVVQEMTAAGITLSAQDKEKMKAKLKAWIEKDASMDPSKAWLKSTFTGGTSLNTGRAQDKRFGSYLALGQALLGHITSRQHKKTESKLAAKVRDSSYIKGKLHQVQSAIATAADAMTKDQLKQDFWAGMGGAQGKKGEYYHWYKGVKDVKSMMQGGTASFKEAIASIHDAASVLVHIKPFSKQDQQTSGWMDPWATGNDFTGTVETDDGTGGVTTSREQIKIGYRANSTTVNEDDPWVKTARAHGALLWAGPSHTTANMMKLLASVQATGAAIDVSHFEAVAWAIFAFWNKDFYTFKDGYHTFHEVMDIAQGYGVPYQPFTYPSQPPPNAYKATTTDEDSESEN